jgi:hypothetical protein
VLVDSSRASAKASSGACVRSPRRAYTDASSRVPTKLGVGLFDFASNVAEG